MKNKKTIIILLLVVLGVVGLTIAYFSNSTTIDNLFSSKQYGTTVEEEFVSPDNWLPGTNTPKTITVTNSGEVDEAVRISYVEEWKAKDGTILSGLIDSNGNLTDNTENSERAAIIHFSDNDDWTLSNGYYYYNYRLAPSETTSSLIDSVEFNSLVKNSSTCTPSNDGKTITCTSTESGYDGATYKLTFTVETVQYDKYMEAWGVEVAIAESKPQGVNFAQHIISKSNAVTVTNYTDGVTTEAYTFERDATTQTPALTDYRYIGASPNNYVYFNCSDNGTDCELWRIIGVFDVDDGNGNYEKRIKMVRNSGLPEKMIWSDNSKNDWNFSSLNTFLNEDYYNRSGSAENYGLKPNTKEFISDAIYYLGGAPYSSNGYGSTDEIYAWERGNQIYNQNNPERKVSSNGIVGLMYPSDVYYVYSLGVDNICYINPNNCYEKLINPANNTYIYNSNPGYPETGWIYNSNDALDIWLLSPASNNDSCSFLMNQYGRFGYTDVSNSGKKSIRPVIYLDADVKVLSGDGTNENPFCLLKNCTNEKYQIYDEIMYDNQNYYIIQISDTYLTLLKSIPLAFSEINGFNTDYVSINGEYPYLENSNCNNTNTTNCNTNYDTSSIKTIVDNWSNNYSNDLVSVGGYKARLLNENDLSNYFDFYSSDGFKTSFDTTPSWVILNDKTYWSMYNLEDSNNKVYGVSNTLLSEDVYNKLYIRPVINLKKCAITNTCE